MSVFINSKQRGCQIKWPFFAVAIFLAADTWPAPLWALATFVIAWGVLEPLWLYRRAADLAQQNAADRLTGKAPDPGSYPDQGLQIRRDAQGWALILAVVVFFAHGH